MSLSQQNNQIISDIDYKDPLQVDSLRQQLIHQYENHCYGSKRISVNQQKKYNKQALNTNNNSEYRDQKMQIQMYQELANKSLEFESQNTIQNERIRQALSQSTTNFPNKKEDLNNLYKVDVPKKSVSRKKSQNLSPSPFRNQIQKMEKMKDSEIQKCMQNQVYLSPLIQNCLEEEIVTQECQRYSSAPSKKYLEMYDYSKDKLLQMYAQTGYQEIGKLYERMESPEKSQNQDIQSYQVEINNQVARVLNSQLQKSNKSILNLSQSQIQSYNVSSSVNSKIASQRNHRIDGNKSMNVSQQNSKEDFNDIKKKLQFAEQYDITKGRNSASIIKSQIIPSFEQNKHWMIQKKRNSTGLIHQISQIKQNDENFQFTQDQRHAHQLIKNSGIYLRNKPEYLSDPRYKLIENLNKISQSVNVKNINNSSVREGQNNKNNSSRMIPYYHNFIQSYKDSFYHPQTNYENNFKICNPRKSQDKNPLPYQKPNTRKAATTPRDKLSRNQSPFDEEKAPFVTPFLEKEIYDNDCVEIRIPNKIDISSKPTLENEENLENQEEFQYYQSSMNKYNALYLNRNQRVRLSRNSSPNRMKKVNALNSSADSNSISKNLNLHNQAILFEDPRREYREKQRKLEEILNVASNKKNQQSDQIQIIQDRYTSHQDSLYHKKTRNYATPYRNNQINNSQVQYPSKTNDYTLDAYVFKQPNN